LQGEDEEMEDLPMDPEEADAEAESVAESSARHVAFEDLPMDEEKDQYVNARPNGPRPNPIARSD
jgi:hypothetical protein